jgi:hypothetical protein
MLSLFAHECTTKVMNTDMFNYYALSWNVYKHCLDLVHSLLTPQL